MKLDLKKIRAAKQERLPFSYDVDLTDIEFYGAHPFRKPVHIEGEIRNHLDILKLTATVHALYETECSRCLAPVTLEMDVPCEFILTDEAQNEDDDSMYLIEGDSVEVDDVVVPAMLLEVPMTCLCKPDCKGLCQTCGKNLNEGECGCGGKQIDSRMAVLQKLLDGMQ